MGSIAELDGQRVYLDANVFIYALDGVQPFAGPIRSLFDVINEGRITAVTSALTLLEVLVVPLRRRDAEQEQHYRTMLRPRPYFELAPVSMAILESAAHLRARASGLRTPDAIHLATARESFCQTLITNDRRMNTNGSPAILLLSDLARG